jgi:hypothetical protein
VPGSNNSTLNFCGLEFERKITFISLFFWRDYFSFFFRLITKQIISNKVSTKN